MATIVVNQDGTLQLNLTTEEQDTSGGLPAGQLEGYITLWLAERRTHVMVERFDKLNDQDKLAVRTVLEKGDSVRP